MKANPFTLQFSIEPNQFINRLSPTEKILDTFRAEQTWYQVPLRKCYECYKDKKPPCVFQQSGKDSFLVF